MEKQTGTLYGIGVGPGDPELITVKAVNILKKADIVYTAASSKNDFSLAKQIATAYIPEGTPVNNLSFPMTKNKDEANKAWEQNAAEILSQLENGKNAVFLTLGDPLIYSTYSYILSVMNRIAPHIQIKTIPGITSFQAAASVLNKPLVQGDEPLLIIAGTNGSEYIRNIGKSVSNIVILKAYKNVKDILKALENNNLKDDAVVVRKCGLPGQEIIYDIDELQYKQNEYWTLILAKRKW